MSDTLVLNKNFYAVQICDWKKALSLLYQGHAQAVDQDYISYSFQDWITYSATLNGSTEFVRTPNLKLAVPEVIRLTRYDSLPRSDVKFTRRNIYQHYGYRCSYCGFEFTPKKLNLDHILPRSRGGQTSWKNIVPSCMECNTHKGDRTPEEAGMKLLVTPSRPTWRGPQIQIAQSTDVCKSSWERFIDKSYWDETNIPEE